MGYVREFVGYARYEGKRFYMQTHFQCQLKAYTDETILAKFLNY